MGQVKQQVTGEQVQVDPLTQCILTKAFRGKLVPEKSDDDSASVLPECIQDGRGEIFWCWVSTLLFGERHFHAVTCNI